MQDREKRAGRLLVAGRDRTPLLQPVPHALDTLPVHIDPVRAVDRSLVAPGRDGRPGAKIPYGRAQRVRRVASVRHDPARDGAPLGAVLHAPDDGFEGLAQVGELAPCLWSHALDQRLKRTPLGIGVDRHGIAPSLSRRRNAPLLDNMQTGAAPGRRRTLTGPRAFSDY